MKAKKRYTSEEKTMILREHLENRVPISDLAEQYNIHPNAIYKWKKQLFEAAPEVSLESARNSQKSRVKMKNKSKSLKRHFDKGIPYS
jgi:transposase